MSCGKPSGELRNCGGAAATGRQRGDEAVAGVGDRGYLRTMSLIGQLATTLVGGIIPWRLKPQFDRCQALASEEGVKPNGTLLELSVSEHAWLLT